MKIENKPEAVALVVALWYVLGICALIVFSSNCAHASKLDDTFGKPNYDAYYDGAVKITAHCSGGPAGIVGWYGSGVIISETRLITAGHVAEHTPEEGNCSFVAEDVNGKTYLVYPVKVFSSDEVDLASMELVSYTEQFTPPPIRFGMTPKLGDRVCTATAYPRREERCGQVMRPENQPPGDIRLDMVVEPGNSGSGLYNDLGELVGIVVHTYPNRGNGQYVAGGATSLWGYYRDLLKR